MRTQINSERKDVTHFTQKAAELLNLKNSLFLSCDGFRKISAEEGGMEERNWLKCGVFDSYPQCQPRCLCLAGEESVALSAGVYIQTPTAIHTHGHGHAHTFYD